jgi:hypothetical protein
LLDRSTAAEQTDAVEQLDSICRPSRNAFGLHSAPRGTVPHRGGGSLFLDMLEQLTLSFKNRTGRPKGSGAGYPTNKPLPLEERIATFWSRTKKGSDSECWLYQGAPDPQTGYPHFSYLAQRIGTHRFCWMITRGEIPKGLCVCHKCDNRICVNPSHLFLGTVADNNWDMKQKGRQSKPPMRCKITPDQVRLIRSLWVPYRRSMASIAKELGLHHKTVESAILHWKSVI